MKDFSADMFLKNQSDIYSSECVREPWGGVEWGLNLCLSMYIKKKSLYSNQNRVAH